MSDVNDQVLIYGLTAAGVPVPLKVAADGTVQVAGGAGGGGGSTIDREVIVTTYRVRVAFTGASVGDLVTQTQIVDVTDTPTTVAVLWRNQTVGADLTNPTVANLDLASSTGLTDAQLRATAVQIASTNLANIDTDLGATADAAATSDTGAFSLIALHKRMLVQQTAGNNNLTQIALNTSDTNSNADLIRQAVGGTGNSAASTDTGSFSIIAFIKRAMQNWTTLLARIPVLVMGRVPVDGSGVTQPVSGTVGISGTVPVSGPLTDVQLRASRVPVNSSIPTSASGTILALTTANPGAGWQAFGNVPCVALDIVNNTGTTIEYRRGATGTAMQIPNGAARMVIGITNANQIDVRRTDTSNTTVTLQAEAFTA